MSTLRSVLDRLNDIDATIARLQAESTTESALAYRLTLQSLENRREMFLKELAKIADQQLIEICDYKFIPENENIYSLSAFTDALHNFQDIVTLVFDAIFNGPKLRASLSADVVNKTSFNFGFTYAGSLGVALTVPNARLLGVDSDLDLTIAAVFDLMKLKSKEEINAAAQKYGRPTIRKLYSWSKTHSDYRISADIKWVRNRETRKSMLAQHQELTEICRMIETNPEETTEPVTVKGTLLSWNTVKRSFIIFVPDAEPISGYLAEGVDITKPRIVRGEKLYEADLLKHTLISYVIDKEDINWELVELRDLE